MPTPLTLTVLPHKLAICRLDKQARIPSWIDPDGDNFFSINRNDDELSIVCREEIVPADIKSDKNWRCFKVEGPIDLASTGVLSSLAAPLSDAKITIFALSTYDTDYVLVRAGQFEEAKKILGDFCKIKQ